MPYAGASAITTLVDILCAHALASSFTGQCNIVRASCKGDAQSVSIAPLAGATQVLFVKIHPHALAGALHHNG